MNAKMADGKMADGFTAVIEKHEDQNSIARVYDSCDRLIDVLTGRLIDVLASLRRCHSEIPKGRTVERRAQE
jgi:hypothetical protein